MEITISAGHHAWPAGPVCFKPQEPLDHKQVYLLVKHKGGHAPIAQVDHEGRLCWWAPAMKARQSFSYAMEPLTPGQKLAGVVVEDNKAADGLIEVTISGKPFTTLNFKKDETKPYLYPVIGPTGDPVTRHYPMKDVEGERKDHHHHRSIWSAHGDVRTRDFDKPASNYWHEKGPKETAVQRVRKITRTVSGPVFGQIQAEIDWNAPDGKRDFTETRTYTFFSGSDDNRIIDVKNAFKFTEADTMFGDTKEGGILALRIATSMDEKPPGKGRMTNINGGVGAKQCWGKAAAWCDYVGPVFSDDPEKVSTVGIAVFDHPGNFRHPTRWHIRDYGLYTANPFGLSHFVGKGKNGSHTWKKGEVAEFNYRILIHKDDTKAARVADHWKLYSAPPKVTGK